MPAAPDPPNENQLDLAEKGAGGRSSDTRLFMQLLAYTGCRDTAALAGHLEQHARTGVVLYEDLGDPLGVALLSFSTDPGDFVTHTRAMIQSGPIGDLTPRPDLTMTGRSYTLGYERDLDETLLRRPVRHATDPVTPWAVWYPLRRSGAFARLPDAEQKDILKEHGSIGFAFGRAGAARDVRLACHGLDAADNDFVIGLMGPRLAPLSQLVQTMRGTVQTSTYLEALGPFFVGRAVLQHLPAEPATPLPDFTIFDD
ncbi:MAG: chlorite dismutase family protein [Planctomycetota bacterium]